MRTKRFVRASMAAVLLFTLVATACSNKTNNSDASSSAPPADPSGKYESPITVKFAGSVDPAMKFKEGEDIANNIWTRMYEEELGIKLQYEWTVPSAQYKEKLNVAIASGSLPDMFVVDASQLKKLVESGQVEDLSTAWEQYAAPFTKESFQQDGGHALQAATFDGKLYAVPNTQSPFDGAPILWVRTDWLNNLKLDEPKSMDDVLNIAEQFALNDPDQNGKKDTYGLVGTKDLWGGFAGFDGFMNGYGAYPEIWVKDDAGKLVYGTVQPAVKVALGKLQHLYQIGAIDPEFGVKDGGKVAESMGKIGMYFGAQWSPIFPLQAVKEQDPAMEWKPIPLVPADGGPALAQSKFPVTAFVVVRKGVQHPEAAVKLVNLFVEKLWGETGDYGKYGTTSDGFEFFKYAAVQAWPARKNLDAQARVTDALASGDVSKLNVEEQGYYDRIVSYRGGDIKNWCWELIDGPVSAQQVLNQYVNENRIIFDEFYGAPTQTMAARKSSLDKMTLETFTKIIMGDASIDEFDKYTDNWSKLGGADMTNEVNDWYATQK